MITATRIDPRRLKPGTRLLVLYKLIFLPDNFLNDRLRDIFRESLLSQIAHSRINE